MKLNPYLHFDSNCKEAFEFYVTNLGAKMLMCMTYADAPPQPGQAACSPAEKAKIMHARLLLGGDSILMGSDSPPGHFRPMAGFTINLGITDTKEAERIYQILSERGEIFMPLEETFWAKKFAMFKDRFGVPWMINVEKEQP